MIITANIATYPPRMNGLKQMISSIYDQVDVIRICFNEMTRDDVPKFIKDLENRYPDNDGKIYFYFPKENLTDNGKFSFLEEGREEYYFTMDDDLVYPHDYVEKTIENIIKYGTIITYHGRILLGKGLDYYFHHEVFRCLADQYVDKRIDVAGTGVCAFDTRYFNPVGLDINDNKKMSDVIFSLEASKSNKKIGCIKHKQGWIKSIDNQETIFRSESRKGTPIQDSLSDEIYTLNYEGKH